MMVMLHGGRIVIAYVPGSGTHHDGNATLCRKVDILFYVTLLVTVRTYF